MRQDILSFYRTPDAMTAAGDHSEAIAGLSADPASVARTVQGLLLHEHWAPAYGQTLSDVRRLETHTRPACEMLDLALEHDPRPIAVERALGERVIGTCRNFSVLAVAMLRAHGTPARARCGFATYFEPGEYVDHWVVEVWDGQQWFLADAQLDAFQRSRIRPDFDTLDVPRDRFVIAHDAWTLARSGGADPQRFGIMDMRGLWFIAGNLVRDAVSLSGRPMLPWDTWGGVMPEPGEAITEDQMALLDRLAELTREPDEHFDALQALCRDDGRVTCPAEVFNAVRGRLERV